MGQRRGKEAEEARQRASSGPSRDPRRKKMKARETRGFRKPG